jgi:hypothetical protein
MNNKHNAMEENNFEAMSLWQWNCWISYTMQWSKNMKQKTMTTEPINEGDETVKWPQKKGVVMS